MRLLKLCGLIVLTIFLSLVVQIPIYLGINMFKGSVVLKITILLIAFLLLSGCLSLVKVKCFPNIPVKKYLSLRTTVGWTLLSFLLIIGIKSILIGFGLDLASANNDDIVQQFNSPNVLVMLVALHFTGPILEEVVFRGIFQESLMRLYPTQKYLPIFLSSFLFAYAHTYVLSANLLDYFISGLLFSVLYCKQRQLRDSIFAHILTNSLITVSSIIAGLLLK
ncbi:CPBP family intramembrane glutamic endopeptidase [Streptococcus suis]